MVSLVHVASIVYPNGAVAKACGSRMACSTRRYRSICNNLYMVRVRKKGVERKRSRADYREGKIEALMEL